MRVSLKEAKRDQRDFDIKKLERQMPFQRFLINIIQFQPSDLNLHRRSILYELLGLVHVQVL